MTSAALTSSSSDGASGSLRPVMAPRKELEAERDLGERIDKARGDDLDLIDFSF